MSSDNRNDEQKAQRIKAKYRKFPSWQLKQAGFSDADLQMVIDAIEGDATESEIEGIISSIKSRINNLPLEPDPEPEPKRQPPIKRPGMP